MQDLLYFTILRAGPDNNSDHYTTFEIILSYCIVPENIHTPAWRSVWNNSAHPLPPKKTPPEIPILALDFCPVRPPSPSKWSLTLCRMSMVIFWWQHNQCGEHSTSPIKWIIIIIRVLTNWSWGEMKQVQHTEKQLIACTHYKKYHLDKKNLCQIKKL